MSDSPEWGLPDHPEWHKPAERLPIIEATLTIRAPGQIEEAQASIDSFANMVRKMMKSHSHPELEITTDVKEIDENE